MKRHFLILQGNSSPFFMALAKALVERGHGLTKINFSGGDHAFWGDWQAQDFTGRLDEFDVFLSGFCQHHDITDLIIHNDCRPFHRIATQVVERLGLTQWVYEEGYLRPDWLTLEKGGINGFSRMPADPAWYLEKAADVPHYDDVAIGSGFKGRVLYDFKWQGMNYLYPRRYPHFFSHRPYPIWAEYLTWARRLSTLHWRGRQAIKVTQSLIHTATPFFLFPLQLDTDSQIRIHSDFKRLAPAIEFVLASFAAHAPAQSHLLIKNHPLDNGWINWRRLVKKIARQHGISSRILFLDGGDLGVMLKHTDGVVTVNSTVGMTALSLHCPVALLGRAVFAIPGLVTADLDSFWAGPQPPDKPLLAAYLKVLRHATLINGNYYTEEGVALAVKESIQRLETSDYLLDECA